MNLSVSIYVNIFVPNHLNSKMNPLSSKHCAVSFRKHIRKNHFDSFHDIKKCTSDESPTVRLDVDDDSSEVLNVLPMSHQQTHFD